jgi:anti-sigma B factor antagonist
VATNVSERTQGEITVLEISGDLDQLYEEEMTKRIDDLVMRGVKQLVIDLSELDLIDSAGIGGLVLLFKRMRAQNGDVKLSGVRGQPAELLERLHLDRAFDVHGDLESAMKAYDVPRA